MSKLHDCKIRFLGALLSVASLWFANVANAQDVTSPTDTVFGVAATAGGASALAVAGTTAEMNNYPANESPNLAFDNLFAGPPASPGATKYLNFAELNTGLIVTPSAASIIRGLRIYTANDAPERDPLTYTIEGTNDATPSTAPGSAWTLISSGDTGLLPVTDRYTAGPFVPFSNSNSYSSYRLLFPTVRDSAEANSMQIGEIELFVPEPSSIALAGASMFGLGWLRRRSRK